MAEAFFQATAWTMDTPKPYGAFHLVLTVLGVSLSIFLARLSLEVTLEADKWRILPISFEE